MKLVDLNCHLVMLRDLQTAQGRLRRLYEKAFPGAQNLDGMPHGSGVHDKVGELAVEIADYETAVEELEKKVKASEVTAEEFISTIDNRDIRLYLRLHFLRDMLWKEVADTCDTTEAAVKSAVYGWFRENNF